MVLIEHAPTRRAGDLRNQAKAMALAMNKPKLIDRVIQAVRPKREPDMKGKWW